MRRLFTTLLIVSLLLPTAFVEIYGQAQSQRHWFLGDGTRGIRFDQPANNATLITKPAVPGYGSGGGVVATDPANGTLLFYTDGSNVYDVGHSVMPNGGGLAGDPAKNNPAVVCPVPGQPNQYYIFTNSAAGTVQFSIVDMTQFGNSLFPSPATGDVTQKNQALPIPASQAEGMIVIPHSNGTDYWLITQTPGIIGTVPSEYSVTQISAGGSFTTTTFSGVGFSISAASFSYHAATGRLAVAPQNPNTDVAILNFDSTTGALAFNQTVLSSGLLSANGQAIYDVEWSPNGDYLYLSVFGDSGNSIQADVLQYDLTNPTVSLTSVLSPQPSSIAESYGLQIAPDSAIYHLYRATPGGPILMGKITNADTVATAVTYTPQAFPGNIDFNAMQFPSFTPSANLNLTVNFTSSGTCSNKPISFFPTVSPAADSLVWDFGDGQSSNIWSPIHTYQNGGPVTVTVTAYLNGQTATASQPLNLTQFDLQLSLVQDTTACICEYKPPVGSSCNGGPFEVTVQAQGGGTPTYQWFGPSGELTGETSASLQPDSAGYYYVVATIGACSASAGVNVKTYDSLDQRANIWHFGQQAGIDFNVPFYNPSLPAQPIQGPVSAPEGVATISDRNGQMILSTDGQFVYDRTGAQLPEQIGGNPNATQSALIIPFPGDETLYYIFTTQATEDGTYELRYSIFDLKLNTNGGLVDLDTSTPVVDASILLHTRTTERLTGNNNWLITHDYGTNCFRSFPITQNGIGSPVVSCAGSDHSLTIEENAEGYMELGPQNMLAVPLSNPGVSNVIEIFDFVDSTGVVTNFRTVDVGSPEPDSQVYGIEFSGSKLFATLKGSTSHIVEMFFDSLAMPHVITQSPIPSVNQQLGAIQTGPDGQVYVAVDGHTFLGTIQVNGDTTLNSTFTLDGFALFGGTTSTLGLPNFIQNLGNPAQGPGLTATGFCVNSPTDFTATGKDPSIDEFDWNFGDGTGWVPNGGPQVSHTYTAPGTYLANVIIRNKCETPVDTLTQLVTVTAPPANPTFLQPGDFPVLCAGPLTLEATPATNPSLPNLDFAWTTGETTRTITIDQQAIYGVTITDTLGCSSSGQLLIADNRPVVDLAPNQTLCENTPVFPLDAQNPGATYAWTINAAPSGTSQTQSVDTSNPGVFEYEVTVTDPVTTCSVRDSTIFTIRESPAFTATPFNTTGCGANDGRIELHINTPASSLFAYSVVGTSGSFSDIDQSPNPLPAAPTVVGNLLAGTYGVTVSDQVSGCAIITTATVNDNAFMVDNPPPLQACDSIRIPVSTTPAIGALTYRVIDQATGSDAVASTAEPGSPFSTANVASGNYVVEVRETATGCIASSAVIPVQQITPIDVNFDLSDICNGNIAVTSVPAGAAFDWSASPTGSINGSTTGTPVRANPGTWLLSVTATDGVNCPGTETIPVTIDNNITADFTQSDACANQVTLSAAPAGSFTYRWYRNGALTPGGQQITAGLTDNGIPFHVEVVSPLTGCVFPSPARAVQVIGNLSVALTSTATCEGVPFTVTATTNQPSATFEWTYNGTLVTGSSATLQDTREGTYSVTATLATCEAEDDIQILLSAVTPGSLNDRAIICDDPANTDPETNQVVLNPGSGFVSYNWFKDGVALGVTDPTFTANEQGIYSVDLVNLFGCEATDQTRVDIDCVPKITGPNAFRPDGFNREFFLFTFFVADTDFQVFIFNRWGEMVYQSNEREFKWNGGYNNATGKPVPPGTYTYVVKYKSSYRPEDGIQEKRGGVVLLR